MEPSKKITPLFFFMSIGVVVSLIVCVSSFLQLSFETLNHAFPDILTDTYTYGYQSYNYETIRTALALIIIVFPLFVVLERYWHRASQSPELSVWNAVLRKWALYLILFLASITIIADLVTLVRYFVSGEITTRFILKVGVTLLAAGIAGWYYVRALRGNVRCRVWFAVVSALVVLGMIIWSFCTIGSPMNQRKLRLDQRRIDDLQSIQWQVINYWQQKEKLPITLDDLANPISGYMLPHDPAFEKGNVYEYSKTGDKSFELCATFDLPMPKGWVPTSGGGIYPMKDTAVSSMSYPGGTGDSWDHETGRTCFTRTIDPDIFPPYPKPVKG